MPSPDPQAERSFNSILASGRKFHRDGKLDRAVDCYQTALRVHPKNPDALYLLGLVMYRQGKVDTAVDLVNQALQVDPEHALAHGSIGQIYQDRRDNKRAVVHFRKAAELRPDNPHLFNGLGLSLVCLGKVQSARDAFNRAIQLKPDMVEAHNNLANLQRSVGNLDEAAQGYRRCLEYRPDFAEAHNNLGVLYQQRQQPALAIQHFETAIKIRTDYPEAHNNLGAVMNDQGDTERALIQFHNAMDMNPGFSEAWVNAGMALQTLGQHGLARETLDVASRIAPDSLTARWGRCIAELESVYWSTGDICAARDGYESRLRHLIGSIDLDDRARRDQAASVVGSMQPFLLPYQGQDDRQLQSLYGDFVCKAMSSYTSPLNGPRRSGPVRVGMVSAFFYDHSNWKVPIQGWLAHLCGEFEMYGYYTGFREDKMTARARSLFHRFYSGKSVEQFAATIQSDGIDVLIYPEVGMHPVTTRLAAQRLVKVQCASWGHPVTTGLPTMDYFLSSDLMEPVDGESCYREQLIRLPGLSFAWVSPSYDDTVLTGREHYGLGPDEVVYLCVQNLCKYLPQYDRILVEIAKRVPRSRLVFLEGPKSVSESLERRLRTGFDQAGVEFDRHVMFLPRLNRDEYRALNLLADVYLDTPDWSGCNSILEALDCNVPVVTLPGNWMRSRHSYAFYRKMQYHALIAENEEHYIELAARLGEDRIWRGIQRRRIAESKSRMIGDAEPVRALSEFIRRVTGQRV